ncbi:MAG: hypothetical protein KAI99_12865 [Cyclobacteriaceae bacterium]|nr:hypothetical protein [Cyclobacteriaceae bacterium]
MNNTFKLLFPLFIFITLLSFQSNAQVVGKPFPSMHTSTADGKVVDLPNDTRGKYTLLGLAFSKKSEDDLNSWMEPVFWKFIDKPEGKIDQLFGNQQYDVNAYFVPMFTGIKTAATKTAKKKALKKMDPRLIPSILFYKGKLKPYKEALDFQRRDIPYFFVLDENGKIVYATSGKYSDAKMAKVEDMISE